MNADNEKSYPRSSAKIRGKYFLRCFDSSIQLFTVFAIIRVLGSTVFLISVAASFALLFGLMILIAFMMAESRCK